MKLKAKHIRKLRKKAKFMQVFKARECWGCFGFDTFRQTEFIEVKATSEYQALQRYFKWYHRNLKKLHRFYKVNEITTYDWGKVEVVNKDGYSTYFR